MSRSTWRTDFVFPSQAARCNMPRMNKTTIALALSAAILLAGSLLHSQSAPPPKTLEFDHTTLHVQDLQKSAAFYEKFLGFERIPDPFKDDKHLWYRIGAHQQLHVVGGATEPVRDDMEQHLAFRVASVPDFIARLDSAHIPYRNFAGEQKVTLRPDGVHQIYLQDPDGYWLEINDSRF
jgi:lactoylglutathione lyase